MGDNKYGNILSYRPYIRETKEKVKASTNNYVDEYKATSDFIDNSPVNNVLAMGNILERAKLIMKELENVFFDTRYNDYTFSQYANMVNDGKLNSANKIYNEAIDDISSDIVIESYKKIHDEYEDVLSFDKTYKSINYGNDDISIKEAEFVDNSTIDEINKYSLERFEKVNYAAMNFESKLNKIVELKLEVSSLYLNTLFATPLATHSEKMQSHKEELKKGSKMLFDSINEEYKEMSKKFDDAKSYEKFDLLYQFICSKIAEYYEALNLSKSLFDNAGSLACNEIEKLIDKKADEIDFYLIELYKIVAKSSIYIDKYSDLLRRKDEIKRYYKS